MGAYFGDASSVAIRHWAKLMRALRVSSREGDMVRIAAPEASSAAPYNGRDGLIESYTPQWVIVRFDNGDSARFRADEILQL